MIEKFMKFAKESHHFVYEQAYSVYELLLKNFEKLNEVIDFSNALEDNVNTRELSSNITTNRKLSELGNFTGSLNGESVTSVLANIDSIESNIDVVESNVALKENSLNITNIRKLDNTGNFTGKINGKTTTQVLADIDSSLSLANTLISLVNARESIGTIYDGGSFSETSTPTIEGGTF